MNSYERHEQAIEQRLLSYLSTREIFGKQVKGRLFKKWQRRYMRERNRDIRRLGKQNQKGYRTYFGRTVYAYYPQEICKGAYVYTCRPRCKGSYPLPFNYAFHLSSMTNKNKKF